MKNIKKSKARQFPTKVLEVMEVRHSMVPMTNPSPKKREASRRAHLDWIKLYAQAWGGVCHTEVYTGADQKQQLECKRGHHFATTYQKLAQGGWCATCLQIEQRLTLEDLQNIAHEHGGECLSTEYVNCRIPMQWRCAQGHEWTTIAAHITVGKWCGICSLYRYDLAYFQEAARQRGGQCLSTHYENKTKLLFQCARNHKFQLTSQVFIKGAWCRTCYDEGRRHSLSDLQTHAHQRGGLCLSPTYTNARTPVQWQCQKGHIWQQSWGQVKTIKGNWCLHCRADELKVRQAKREALKQKRLEEREARAYVREQERKARAINRKRKKKSISVPIML